MTHQRFMVVTPTGAVRVAHVSEYAAGQWLVSHEGTADYRLIPCNCRVERAVLESAMESAAIAEAERKYVACDFCGDEHIAEFHHVSKHGGNVKVYAVVCTVDQLTTFYTDEALRRREGR